MPTGTLNCKWSRHMVQAAVSSTDSMSSRSDVFIENSKALIQEGSDAQARSTLQTLYTVLSNALVLSHPFLPFVTEELWQRLPRRPGDATRSVMVARYPEWDPQFDSPAAEAAYEVVLGCSKGIRSLMAGYAPKGEAKIFIQAHDAATQHIISAQKSSIRSLSGKGPMTIHVIPTESARPAGCVAFPVSSAASVFIHVKGRVDLDAEIAKASKKLEKAASVVEKQGKLVTDAKYLEKVAVATQDADRKKLADLESEARGFEATIEQFEELKLE